MNPMMSGSPVLVSCDEPDESASPFTSIPTKFYHKIIHHLRKLEQSHKITILLAVENGSRLTDLYHDGSDYDIRFVFRYNRPCLNSTEGRSMLDMRDTIEGFSSDKLIDWQGWCIDKAIKCLKSSNPSMIEWLQSDIIYIGNPGFISGFRGVMVQMHNVKSLYYHYLNMAKKNWNEWIKDKEQVIYKKYLYVLRPILMIIYILSEDYENTKATEPVINKFFQLLDHVTKLCSVSIPFYVEGVSDDESDDDSVPEMKQVFFAKNRLGSKVLSDIALLVQMKQTDKLFTGKSLEALDQWIKNFFSVSEKMMQKKDSSRKQHLTFQALASTKHKLSNEIDKINAIGRKNEVINRNNYLSLFGQYLLYMWLIQNPQKHSGEAPPNIGQLLREVKIDPELTEWIRSIVMTKVESKVDPKVRDQRVGVTQDILSAIMGFIQRLVVHGELGESDELAKLTDWISKVDADTKDSSKLLRDDMIDLYMRKILEIIWVLRSDQNLHNLPKDIMGDKRAKSHIPSELLNASKLILGSTKPLYMVEKGQRFHDMIERDFLDNIPYVEKTTAKYQRKKEIDRKDLLKGNVVDIDPEVFLSLYETFSQ